jgi:hypothetical protein
MQVDPDRIERKALRRFRKVIAKSLKFVTAVIARSEATKQSNSCCVARWIASLRSQ